MSGSADHACPPASGELIARMSRRGIRLGALAGKGGKYALDLAPDATHGNAKNTLTALDQVDDLLSRGALVHAGSIAHQGDLGEVLDTTLTKMADRDANLLQRDPTVQQSLDHLQDKDVAKAVETLGPRAGGAANGGLDQARAGPVVQLAVGDARGATGGGTAVAGVLAQLGKVVAEQHALCRDRCRTGVMPPFSRGVHAYLLVNYNLVVSPDGTADGTRASITTLGNFRRVASREPKP